MKKIYAILLCGALSMLVLSTICFGAKQNQKYVLKLSHQMANTHTLNKVALRFADLVKAKTAGKVEVQVFPAATLGSERENAEALKSGTLDLGFIAVEFYPAYVKEAAVLVLPYMYNDYPHLKKVLNGKVASAVANMIKASTNIRVLAYLPMAFRQVFTTDKPLNDAGDIKGLKIRVPESPIYVAAFKQLGAVPTPMAWGEVYTALETGVVKGVENTPEAILSVSLNEVVKYMNITNHLTAPSTISISEAVFQKLPKQFQKAITVAAKEAAQYDYEQVVETDSKYQKQISAKVKVVKSNISSFRKMINYNQLEIVSSPKAKQLIKELLKTR
jgi:tripartite ATP-independent transporter DctP family solute receptor